MDRKKFDLEKWLVEQEVWSSRTFGHGRRTNGICSHIQKELIEIADAPDDLMEWIDVVILALDGAWRTGHTASEITQALEDKQRVNINRAWEDKSLGDVPIHHRKSLIKHKKLLCKDCGGEITGLPHRSVSLLEDGVCDGCHDKNVSMFVDAL
jgi:hypothetical protein